MHRICRITLCCFRFSVQSHPSSFLVRGWIQHPLESLHASALPTPHPPGPQLPQLPSRRPPRPVLLSGCRGTGEQPAGGGGGSRGSGSGCGSATPSAPEETRHWKLRDHVPGQQEYSQHVLCQSQHLTYQIYTKSRFVACLSGSTHTHRHINTSHIMWYHSSLQILWPVNQKMWSLFKIRQSFGTSQTSRGIKVTILDPQ